MRQKMSPSRTASFVRTCADCQDVWYHPSNCDSACPCCNPNYRSHCRECETIWYHAEHTATLCPVCNPIKFHHLFPDDHPARSEPVLWMHVWIHNNALIKLNTAEAKLWQAKKRLKLADAYYEEKFDDLNKILLS